MLKRFGTTALVMVGAAAIAVGYGRLVYPVNPLIVWCLLLFCWLCYRLRRRAIDTFGHRDATQSEFGRRTIDIANDVPPSSQDHTPA